MKGFDWLSVFSSGTDNKEVFGTWFAPFLVFISPFTFILGTCHSINQDGKYSVTWKSFILWRSIFLIEHNMAVSVDILGNTYSSTFNQMLILHNNVCIFRLSIWQSTSVILLNLLFVPIFKYLIQIVWDAVFRLVSFVFIGFWYLQLNLSNHSEIFLERNSCQQFCKIFNPHQQNQP